MPKRIQNFFFSKFRKPSSPNTPRTPTSKTYSSPTCRILPRCRVPRTPSFSLERGEYVDYGEENAAIVSDSIDHLMFGNFNSIYKTNSEQSSKQDARTSSEHSQFTDFPPKNKVSPLPDQVLASGIDRFLLENSREKQRDGVGALSKPSQLIDSQPKSKTSTDSDAAFVSDVDRFLLENFDSLFNQAKIGSEEDYDFRSQKGRNQKDMVFFEPSRQSISSLAKADRFDFENFRSINADYEKREEQRARVFFESSRQSIDLHRDIDVGHSDRFFVTASRSSSLMEEAWMSSTAASDDAKSSMSTVTADSSDARDETVAIPNDSVAVLTRSVDPYDDFRRSMKEMVEARLQQGEEADWDFMEELLFCYLNLNEKGSHRYILRAFADLVGTNFRPSFSGESR